MIHPTSHIGLPRIATFLAGKGIAAAWRWSIRNWDELLLRAAIVGGAAACLFALGAI